MTADPLYYRVADLVFALRGEALCRAVQTLPGWSPFALDPGQGDSWAREAAFGIDKSSAYIYKKEGGLRGAELRLALWLAYGAEALAHGRMALHASAVVYAGKAYLFLGESGTGKSTHTRLWREHIPGAWLLNDDSPVLQVGPQGAVTVWGSPWSGKTPCYINEGCPLGGLVRLVQAPHNEMRRLGTLAALASLHPSAPPEFARGPLYDKVVDLLAVLLRNYPVYQLECRPHAEAAHLAFKTLVG